MNQPNTHQVRPGQLTIVRAISLLSMIAGVVMIIAGGVVWGVVSSQLADQQITVSEDAPFLAGAQAIGPFSALAQAEAINLHATAMADGKTYAQLEQDDPIRATVMDASFLRASLFTSVVSFGVSVFVTRLQHHRTITHKLGDTP